MRAIFSASSTKLASHAAELVSHAGSDLIPIISTEFTLEIASKKEILNEMNAAKNKKARKGKK